MSRVIRTANMAHLSVELKSGSVIGCGICKANFEEDDDFVYAGYTGTCPYCHQTLNLIKVKD